MSKFDQWIKCYPDFPKEGILFRDISPLLASPEGMSMVKKEFVSLISDWKPDLIAGIDARGFLFSSLIGEAMNIGTLMIRKSGKLPGEVIERSYDLEYGSNKLAMQKTNRLKGKKVIIMDDLLATGGTLMCARELIESQGALVCGCAVVVELSFLRGSELLECPVVSLASYED
mgnify:FL=1|tara:strand:+ start:102 stop:620 length:519 start_codon:yes stop_codon:yes gene_type:complete